MGVAGEGIATRKYDGTCVMLDFFGEWFARREVKPWKPAPNNYVPVSTDTATGKIVGWEPVNQSPYFKYFQEAVENLEQYYPDWSWNIGTYELCGPKVQGNPEGYESHQLIPHAGAASLGSVERTYDGIRALVLPLREASIEGIVFHHPDGRMAKIKIKDFDVQ